MKDIRIIVAAVAFLIIAGCSPIETYEGFVKRGDGYAERQKYADAFENYSYAWQMVERTGANKPVSYKISKIFILEKRADMREKLGDEKGVADDRKLATYIKKKSDVYEKDYKRLMAKLKAQGLSSCGPHSLDECVNNLLLHGPQTIEVPDGFLFINMDGDVYWE